MLKRFALFEYADFYPSGGWEDLTGTYDTAEEAFGASTYSGMTQAHTNEQVIDLRTGEEIKRETRVQPPSIAEVRQAAALVKPYPTRVRGGKDVMATAILWTKKVTATLNLPEIDPKFLSFTRTMCIGMEWELDKELKPNEFIFG